MHQQELEFPAHRRCFCRAPCFRDVVALRTGIDAMVGTGAGSVKPSGFADKALPIGTRPRGTETQTARATRARVRSGRRNRDEWPAGVDGSPRAVAAIAARGSLG